MFWRKKKEPQGVDQDLLKVLDLITSEKIAPNEGAKRIRRFLSYAISLHDLDQLALQMHDSGRQIGALRLAETNMILAEEQNEEKLKVQCACTLAQFLSGDRQRTEERWQLLEYAVPELMTWNISGEVKGAMIAYLADARFSVLDTQPSLHSGVLEAVEQALLYEHQIDRFLLGRLYFIAGSTLDEMGEDETLLYQSIQYLEAALQYYPENKYPAEYASALNNLGNSYRDLGRVKNDGELIRKAIAIYDQALPYRTSPELRVRTQNNRKESVDLLQKITSHEPLPQRVSESTEDRRIRLLLRAGDDSLYASMKKDAGSERDRQTAAQKYMEASRLAGRAADPSLRAEILHRFATLFVKAMEDNPLWTGYCFANATQRLAQGHWREVSQSRVLMHRGEMLVKIGFPDHEQILNYAEQLLRASLPIMEAQGHPGEADEARQYLGMALSILTARGGADHATRARDFYAKEESTRLENLNPELSRNVPSREKFRHYAQMLKAIAPEERDLALGALRAEGNASIANQHVDEFNHALMLLEVAGKYLVLGELGGALENIKTAEKYASEARFSAPSVWCQLAKFYFSIPMIEHARRCVDTARSKMDHVAPDGVAVLPGDGSERWIPEYDLESYQQEIEESEQEISKATTKFQFDPAGTARLLCPEDAARRQAIQTELEKRIGRLS